jgi:hypothetical protein
MAQFGAAVQFRTSLDQAGQVAGLAGELGISESDVWRRLAGWSLEAGSKNVLTRLRREIAEERERDERGEREHFRRRGIEVLDVDVSELERSE